MTIERSIRAATQTALESSQTGDAYIYFVRFSHPDLADDIRITSDQPGYNYILNGATWYSYGFSIGMLQDDENPPQTRLKVSNVDRSIGPRLQALATPLTVSIDIYPKSDFTDDNPRVAVSTPVSEYPAVNLFLRNVECNVMDITGEVVGYDLATEPWPAINTTPDNAPALYW